MTINLNQYNRAPHWQQLAIWRHVRETIESNASHDADKLRDRVCNALGVSHDLFDHVRESLLNSGAMV